ncbi:hypothetical protein M3689_20395 [Alkalihalophilus marmarensis]|jgi:hypothetical protein|uniref:Uncharacterized protein n=1 Tax=Alkalihalophilus marmarensis DSM 21297 TaxID=1188261 RepID=U6SPN5_9BACI|nr:hypothetical protein [Alkalihalophilus marmarensis]ERN52616.1 hypothetical protein A33I_00765 [Alkalihalophilus marmarensis DSM 21297]MCM3491655.1 hypothetical protein [Alkalihalophilus marmarensis]
MVNTNLQLIYSEYKLSQRLLNSIHKVVNKIVKEYCLQPVEERHVVTLLKLITTYKRDLDKSLFATIKEYIEVLAVLVDHLIFVLTEIDGDVQIEGVGNDLCVVQEVNGKVNLKKMVVQADPQKVSIYLKELRKIGIKVCDEGDLTLEVIDMISGKRYTGLQDTGYIHQEVYPYQTTNLIAEINHFCS